MRETEVGESTFRKYHYECGSIQVPRNKLEKRRITHTSVGVGTPEWFKELIRTAKAIWDDALIKERHKGAMGPLTRNNYMQKTYFKIELEKLFEQHKWVIPHYIYWTQKTNFKVFAVLDYDERTPFVVPLEGTKRDEILRLLQNDGVNLIHITQQIVQMKKA